MTPKSHRRPTYLLPAEFDAEAVVGWLKADAARWLVSTVLRKLTVNDVDSSGFAILSSTILERCMGRGYARIVKRLADAGVLVRSSYSEGRSFGYRLSDEYLDGKPQRVAVTNPIMLDRLKREQQRLDAEQAQRRLPIHDRLNDAQHGLTMLPAAHDVMERLSRKSQLCQRVHVDRIERNDLPLSIAATMRLFNGLSGVSKDLRPFVRLGGAPMGSVDISASQPALLGVLLTNGFPCQWGKGVQNIKVAPPSVLRPPRPVLRCLAAAGSAASFARFASVAGDGVLYDELSESLGMERKPLKHRFIVDCLAKKGDYRSRVEDEFRRRFPETWEAVRRINANDRSNLIRLLQRFESWLVVEGIAANLVERIPVVSLHDQLFATRGDVSLLEEAFAETLERLGYHMTFKIDVDGTERKVTI